MRRIFSRILLVALVIAAGVAVYRVAAGSRGGAVVSLEGLHAGALAHEAFTVTETARLAIDAAGSFEERPDTALAALGWIVRRPDGAVVWRQRPGAPCARPPLVRPRHRRARAGDLRRLLRELRRPARPRRGDAGAHGRAGPRLAHPRGALSGRAGVAGRGRPLAPRRLAGDAQDRGHAATLDSDDDEPTTDSDLIWTTGALESDETPSTLVRVSQPATVEIDAVLEAAGGVVADSAALVRATAPFDTLWTFRAEGSAWAGGSVKNRHARARLRLAPGLYRLSARTDDAHAAGDWTANPPWAPWAWGVRLRRAGGPADAVAVFDAATAAADASAGRLPEIAGVRCVGPDQTWEASFTLSTPVEALLVAQGEIDGSDRYDYATLYRDGDQIWQMTRDATQPAGGASRNRRAEALLSLVPGDYRLTFQTDGSHDCDGGFNGDEPDDPSLWGAVLIAVDPAFDASTLQRETPSTRADSGVDDNRAAPNNDGSDDNGTRRTGGTLVMFARVGNDARLETAFTLAGPTRLHVVAQGELFPDEALDYGWISQASGNRVWVLTRSNTEPAGGASKNRRFDGVLVLPAGRYTAHYVTDARHAFGDFGDDAPDDPDAWGLRIDRAAAD